MDGWRVLDDDQVLALQAAKAQLGDCLCSLGQKPLLVGRIDPGACDNLSPIHRPKIVLVDRRQLLECISRDKSFANQQRLKSLNPRLKSLRLFWRQLALKLRIRLRVVVAVLCSVLSTHGECLAAKSSKF